ncbi:uncharacterized protein LACBIDRAFT_306337 [Laccaria bicolor S238N-H82]|uniref:Predicted protein n=1 Tax=Laccaria bicolor (strain S238N-H82 / ATCC MYA-4686) TaxID=486041 RepID=B0DN56_LACBS|nr:uncharacterized protein LACBIDRAFT_306337 [Laccaria bicolor S238N-H82]EDR04086.1 predicted protein [Laccaria bicolor S238N-H82]|eukprot:XP_001885341.1 predicted protein [Laccaria bicolor S238N-H82]
MAEIFYNALGSLTDFDFLVGANPFFLGKICRCWRDVVWSTPILWTTLYLRLSSDNYKAQTVLLRDWLSRTGKRPISFCLDMEDFLETRPRRYHAPVKVLTLFASISERWREIYISFHNLQACFNIISPAKQSLPLLTTATIYVASTGYELDLLRLMAPQLSQLHLHASRSFGLLRKVLVVPWHQLQEFFAESCYRDEIRFFLQNALHIVRCTFTAIESRYLERSLEQELHRPLLLEHLQYLELHFEVDNVFVESGWIFKGQVRFPSLREFSLYNPAENGPQDAVLLQITNSFQSSPLLERFTWSAMIMSNHDLIQALKNIPSVKDLSLNFLSYPRIKLLNGEFLQRLYSGILLPNLRSFSYHGATSLNEHMHLFRDVLVHRFRKCATRADKIGSERTTVAQIKSVSMTSTSELVVSSDIQEELNSLVKAGLEFTLHFCTHLGMKSLRTLNGVLLLE